MEGQVFGRSIGEYELLNRINRGSISELYRVRSHNTGDIYAIRKLLPHLSNDSEARSTFLRGAEIEVELDHPNILKVHTIGNQNGEPYVVIDYVEGDNLKQWILAKSITTVDQALRMMHSLADALASIHAKGIIHHDIKPENILVSNTGVVKLTDFSLAIKMKKDYISSKRISGSPSYVAPEIIRRKSYDERVDIYSLGITAYELLTGQLPYSGQSPKETLQKHLSRFVRAVPIRKMNADVPPKLVTAVEKAMEKSRRRRYPHVSLFVRDLKEVAREMRVEL